MTLAIAERDFRAGHKKFGSNQLLIGIAKHLRVESKYPLGLQRTILFASVQNSDHEKLISPPVRGNAPR
jgi:hypothetical protein